MCARTEQGKGQPRSPHGREDDSAWGRVWGTHRRPLFCCWFRLCRFVNLRFYLDCLVDDAVRQVCNRFRNPCASAPTAGSHTLTSHFLPTDTHSTTRTR